MDSLRTLPRHVTWLLIAGFGVVPVAASGNEAAPRIPSGPSRITADSVDARTDGWDTEIFAERAGAQLKRLAGLFETGAPLDGEALSSLVTPGFATAGLRPGPLEVVHRTATLEVRRPAVASTASRDHGERGVAALREASRLLLEPLGSTDRHVALKVISVEPGPATTTTRALYHASARSADRGRQQNAVWLCEWESGAGDAAPRLQAIHVADYEEATLRAPGATWFSDCTASVLDGNPSFSEQLRFGTEHWMRRIQASLGIDNYGHNGLAVGDVNGDGLEDLYLCQTGGLPNRLFVQNPDGTARDVSAEAGVDLLERSHGALLLDFDNDGDADLALGTSSSLLILANDGTGRFERAAELPAPYSYSLVAADYDADGDLDLYATRYAEAEALIEQAGIGLQPMPYQDANNGAPNVLFRNEGALRFRDVTAQVGLDVNNRRWSLAAAWEDFDNDGDPDLYVANDFGRNNLYRNDGGRFVDVAAQAGVEDVASGMSVSWGDYDGDGWMDLYVGNMFSGAGNRIAFQRRFHADEDQAVRADFQRLARGNSLFRNLGDGSFEDVSLEAGVTVGHWAWSSTFADLDNDGAEDLVVANGYITNENSGDL